MFIHSHLSLADTNQPIVYSGLGETKEFQLQLVAEARKTITFYVCHQVAWWCKVPHQPGGGGFGRTPRKSFSCEVIHAFTPSKLGGNWACGRVLCQGCYTSSAGIKCRYCIAQGLVYLNPTNHGVHANGMVPQYSSFSYSYP